MTGLAIAAGDAGLRTFAAQRLGDLRAAEGEYFVRPERGGAGADDSARPPALKLIPCPQSNSQTAGRGGSDQSRSMVSRRAHDGPIIQCDVAGRQDESRQFVTVSSTGTDCHRRSSPLVEDGGEPLALVVLIFDVVPGLVAQWESVRLTRGRSLVRNQPGPQAKRPVQGLFFRVIRAMVAIVIRPISGQILRPSGKWFYGRSARASSRASSAEATSSSSSS